MKTTSTKSEALTASVKNTSDKIEVTKNEINEYKKIKSKLLKQAFVFTHKEYAVKYFPQYFI